MHRISGTHQNKSLISLKTVGLSSMSSSSSSISFLFVFCFTATLKRGRIRFSCRLSHVCSEFDSRSLPYNVLWDGPGIQEVTLFVSIATLRSAMWGRRPLLKHKGPLAWINTRINTHGPHTQMQTRSQGHKSHSTIQTLPLLSPKKHSYSTIVQLLSTGTFECHLKWFWRLYWRQSRE